MKQCPLCKKDNIQFEDWLLEEKQHTALPVCNSCWILKDNKTIRSEVYQYFEREKQHEL